MASPDDLGDILTETRRPPRVLVSELQGRVDAHFDRLAEIIRGVPRTDRIPDGASVYLEDVNTLRKVLVQALDTRDRRLAAERRSNLARLTRAMPEDAPALEDRPSR